MAGAEVDDDDLVARWELVLEGVASAQRVMLKQIETSGVPAQWFAVLHVLLRAPANRMPMSKLARDLSMTSGGFTKLADRIAREGLIDRRGSSGDRRVVYATLTDRGRRLARKATSEYHGALHAYILDVLSVADLTAMAGFAGELHRAHASEPVEPESKANATSPRRIGKREAASPRGVPVETPEPDRRGA